MYTMASIYDMFSVVDPRRWRFEMSSRRSSSTRRSPMSESKAHRMFSHRIRKSKLFLSHVCLDSGDCLAFGDRSVEMNKLFEFNTFKHATNITPISSGANGDTFALKYHLKEDHRNYTAYAILKSSKNESADNLMYEYMAGIHYVNDKCLKFPCFVTTYGIYTSPHPITKRDHLKDLVLHRDSYKIACSQSGELSILIQHLRGDTLRDFMEEPNFVMHDLTNMLYMVYQALSSLSSTFTHYDLHSKNVMIHELEGPIEYVYEDEKDENGNVLIFRSLFIPKIIDYGRCFFDNGSFSSRDIYENICKTPECTRGTETCGEAVGFDHLGGPLFQDLLITATKKNESHDLRLLNSVHQLNTRLSSLPMDDRRGITALLRLASDVLYGDGIPKVKYRSYGTRENLTGNPPFPRILNIHDAKNRLQSLVVSNQMLYTNIIGRLIISKNKPMVYERIKS